MAESENRPDINAVIDYLLSCKSRITDNEELFRTFLNCIDKWCRVNFEATVKKLDSLLSKVYPDLLEGFLEVTKDIDLSHAESPLTAGVEDRFFCAEESTGGNGKWLNSTPSSSFSDIGASFPVLEHFEVPATRPRARGKCRNFAILNLLKMKEQKEEGEEIVIGCKTRSHDVDVSKECVSEPPVKAECQSEPLNHPCVPSRGKHSGEREEILSLEESFVKSDASIVPGLNLNLPDSFTPQREDLMLSTEDYLTETESQESELVEDVSKQPARWIGCGDPLQVLEAHPKDCQDGENLLANSKVIENPESAELADHVTCSNDDSIPRAVSPTSTQTDASGTRGDSREAEPPEINEYAYGLVTLTIETAMKSVGAMELPQSHLGKTPDDTSSIKGSEPETPDKPNSVDVVAGMFQIRLDPVQSPQHDNAKNKNHLANPNPLVPCEYTSLIFDPAIFETSPIAVPDFLDVD